MRLYEVQGFFTMKGWGRVHIFINYEVVGDPIGIDEPLRYRWLVSVCHLAHVDEKGMDFLQIVDVHDVYKYKLCKKCKKLIKKL